MSKAKLAHIPGGYSNPDSGIQFITFTISCHSIADEDKELIALEISPLALLAASVAMNKTTGVCIETAMANAFLSVMDSVQEQFTILEISHK